MLLLCSILLSTFLISVSAGKDPKVVEYRDPVDNSTLKGYIAYPEDLSTKKPVVLIVHDWDGLDYYESKRARLLANDMGYIAFAVDIYGNGATGSNPTENRHLMAPYRSDRLKLQQRLKAAYQHAISGIEEADKQKIASIGYCFGGMASIDMARANLGVKGVASFHGALQAPDGTAASKDEIKPKVLVMTGYNDPSIPPELVAAFQKEMTDSGADFEVVSYANTVHSFTNWDANVPGRSKYNKQSDERSWSRLRSFLKEIFA